MTTQSFPACLTSTFQSKNGVQITLRPIKPEDAQREQAFIKELSPETRYRRFMSTLRELSPAQLDHFTHIDYDREMAFIALLEENGSEKEVGVCRYAASPDGESCEFAIVVADDWQGQGLGHHLMERLIAAARNHGFKYMTGEFLAENSPMLKFVASMGFELAPHPNDRCLKHGILILNAPLPTS